MTTPVLPPLEPTDELAAAGWLASLTGFSPAMVGTVLPPDVNADGTPAAWIQTGFVTVAVVGGNPHPLLPVNTTVIQADVTATLPGSEIPPWGMAATLAAVIRRACWNYRGFPRTVPVSVGNVAYPSATIRSAYVTRAFARVYDDVADYARYSGDFTLIWHMLNDRLD